MLLLMLTYPVLVNDVDDCGDLSGLGTILEDGDPTDLNEFLERLHAHGTKTKQKPGSLIN